VLASVGGTGPTLRYLNNAVTVGQFGTIAPIAAEQTANGYEVAWKIPGADTYVVWNTDTNGNYISGATGAVSGSDPTLEALEPSFQQDLNGDGKFGLKANQVIETSGATSLWQVGTAYVLASVGGTGPTLRYLNNAVTVGQFGTIAPIAAEQTANGYEVAWKIPGADTYVVWNTDTNGNYISGATGAVSGSDPTLEALEPSFSQDLNGDGITGFKPTPVVQVDGTTTLGVVGNAYVMLGSGGTGVALQYNGVNVLAGSLGPWAPIGAIANAGGYEVAWRNGTGSAAQYIVWQTNSSGNYTGGLTGVVSGTDVSLENLEPSFQQDINGDGTTGPKFTSIIQVDGGATLGLVGTGYALLNSGGTAVALQYNGVNVLAGSLGPWAPIGAIANAGGYEVAWRNGTGSAAQYIVWQTNSSGNYTNGLTGVVSGQDFSLEDLEPSFQQDLNGDGRLSTQLITAGPSVDLIGQSQATTINVGADTASARAGLSAPSLTFIGTPDALTLGSGASIVEFALQPSSGIETVANFVLGTDLLNIDLAGAAGMLEAFNTTVGGNLAIALASSGDLSHGIVLVNVSTGLTAANLMASHTTFANGHALIT
jgi:serralysin